MKTKKSIRSLVLTASLLLCTTDLKAAYAQRRVPDVKNQYTTGRFADYAYRTNCVRKLVTEYLQGVDPSGSYGDFVALPRYRTSCTPVFHALLDMMAMPTDLAPSDFSFPVNKSIRSDVSQQFAAERPNDSIVVAFAKSNLPSRLSTHAQPHRVIITTNNMVDSYAWLFLEIWAAANQTIVTPTPQQLAAVKRQVTNAIAQTSLRDTLKDSQSLQRISDNMMIQAMIIAEANHAVRNDPTVSYTKFAQSFSEMTKEQYGTDFATLQLTKNGFSR